jgi:hypothetical protein
VIYCGLSKVSVLNPQCLHVQEAIVSGANWVIPQTPSFGCESMRVLMIYHDKWGVLEYEGNWLWTPSGRRLRCKAAFNMQMFQKMIPTSINIYIVNEWYRVAMTIQSSPTYIDDQSDGRTEDKSYQNIRQFRVQRLRLNWAKSGSGKCNWLVRYEASNWVTYIHIPSCATYNYL